MIGRPFCGSCELAGPTEATIAAAAMSATAREAGVLRGSLLSPRPVVMTGSDSRAIPAQTRKTPGYGQRGGDHDLGMRGEACGMRQLRGDAARMTSDRSRSCSMRR